MTGLDLKSKFLILVMGALGLLTVTYAWSLQRPFDLPHFAAFLVVALLGARLKISLPKLDGNMSMNLPVILVAMVELSLMETLIIAASSALLQCFWNVNKKAGASKMIFNISTIATAITLAYFVFHRGFTGSAVAASPLRMGLATLAYLLVNTLPVAGIIAFTEPGNFTDKWREILRLSFPYYVASAGLATMAHTLDGYAGWQAMITLLPFMAMLYSSFKLYFTLPPDAVTGSRLVAAASNAQVHELMGL